MARTMLNESKLNDKFWGQAVHTAVHIMNRGLLESKNDKTPYELWTGRAANIRHFRIFGSKCYIQREDKKIGKFDSRVDERICVGYSSKRKALQMLQFEIKQSNRKNQCENRWDQTNIIKKEIRRIGQ